MPKKQRRNPEPPIKSHYRKYKPELREDFTYSCAFCEIWESERGGDASFHVEHYKPKKKFPKLIHAYKNLLYACRDCNWIKGTFWPGPLDRLFDRYVLNPYEHDLDINIDKSAYKWEGVTTVGKWNVIKFKLDSKFKIKKRRARYLNQDLLSKVKQEIERNASFLEKAQSAGDSLQIIQFSSSITELQEQVEHLLELLEPRLDNEA